MLLRLMIEAGLIFWAAHDFLGPAQHGVQAGDMVRQRVFLFGDFGEVFLDL